MKPQLVISGAAGRMGRRILALAVENQEFTIAAAIDRKDHPDMGKDAGLLAGIDAINVPLSTTMPKEADVMIDFSSPDAAEAHIQQCQENHCALVLGTTGLSPSQMETATAASHTVPILIATNMSVGMNLLFNIIGKVAAALGQDYDIEIVEHHHKHKKDAPSGTALTLASNIASATGRAYPDSLVHGRFGKEALRQPGTIGMHAVRAGDIVGYHEVIFSTAGETVTMSHNAHSRDVFVRGAVRAAKWIMAQQPGLYSMQDVLGLK
jgi:4-hydroxy-tetrahydrodipicolinate reductase